MESILIFSFSKIFIYQKSILKFFIFSVLGLGFSLSVVLITLGLMNGFEWYFKKSLQESLGDFYVTEWSKDLDFIAQEDYISLIQTKGFVSFNDNGKGVLAKGIDENYFSFFNKKNIVVEKNSILIGKTLQKALGLNIGDELFFYFKSERLHKVVLKVQEMVDHGIYEHDLRFVYLNKYFLKSFFKEKEENLYLIKNQKYKDLLIDKNIYFKESWEDYGALLTAVQSQKKSIVIVFQIIVLVAFFNIISFQIFMKQKKSQEIFLLYALGLSMKNFRKLWLFISFQSYFLSSFIALLIFFALNFILKNFNWIKIPSNIYYLKYFDLIIYPINYIQVFGISFLTILFLAMTQLYFLNSSKFMNLREEFAQ